jgi:hypothetical protein
VAGCCENGNEPSGFIKGGEFLDELSVQLTSQEGLCCVELYIFSYTGLFILKRFIDI